MTTSERQIVEWLRDMCRRAPSSGHGMQGHLAAILWEKVAAGIERGDPRRHAELVKASRETIRQAGPAREP